MTRNTYVFPDGRTVRVERKARIGSCGKVPITDKPLEQQIKELLEVGVSRKMIACHLGTELGLVTKICARWKKNELPGILQKRANVPHEEQK
jgi:hypothetical protein